MFKKSIKYICVYISINIYVYGYVMVYNSSYQKGGRFGTPMVYQYYKTLIFTKIFIGS